MHSNAAARETRATAQTSTKRSFRKEFRSLLIEVNSAPVGKSISCSQGSPFSGGRVNQAPSVDNLNNGARFGAVKPEGLRQSVLDRRWFTTSVRAEPKRTAGVSSPPLFSAA